MLHTVRISSSLSPSSFNSKRFPPNCRRGFPRTPNSLLHPFSYLAMFGQLAAALRAVSPDGSSVKELDESPVSIDLQPLNESNFDRVIAEAQQLDESVVIVWMASWCRKCIVLKPKLEKLAADYYPRLQFYCVDVNKVSHKLVTRAGVTKMPTIQVWKDGEKQAEVIGGQKPHFVISEVRQMIESDSDP
ncbi:hypothetical protein SAY86_024121 [Trapa natans]|uniref:Thioredoxin domain-containing protein n=1 Tax=Trapa natans TaxID=22666 RepID=A0AAN7MBJ6_TRANT|nr:hypothetical protein SAY86_024121 [Trapa natans]